MSLIEQLGGYEKAKTKADELDYDLNNLEFLGGGSARESMYESLDSIEKALLQYRRQHKIFEVGDWVVSILHGSGDNVFQFENWLVDFEDCIRHATDAEIKAGRRLDLPESVVKSLGEVS